MLTLGFLGETVKLVIVLVAYMVVRLSLVGHPQRWNDGNIFCWCCVT
jgi:hypothetical protein